MSWIKKRIFWLVLIVLTVPTFISLLRPGYFFMQDDLQAFRLLEMSKCFTDLQIPCRWVPDPGYQYGYPQFIYYPPSVYYFGQIFHLIGFQLIDTVKILFSLGLLLSAVSMFVFLKSLFGRWPALVGGLLYVYAPYKALNTYVRGDLSELWASAIFPLIFWSIYCFIKKPVLKYFIWISISIGLLLTTHNLMSMIFLPLAGLWALLWLILEKNFLKLWWKLGGGALLGLGLAAFYSLPALIEKPFAHLESLTGGYFGWQQHFVDIQRLFISNIWGYGSSNLGQTEAISLSAGQALWAGSVLAVILALLFWKTQKKYSVSILATAAAALLVLFMIHRRSSFIWEKIGFLEWMQFPWRFLADSTFLLGILSGGAVFLVNSKRLAWGLGVILIAATLVLHVGFFHPKNWFDMSDQQKFSGVLWEKQLTISIFDYLPIYAKLPPIKKAPDIPEVLEGSAKFLSYKKGSDWQYGLVDVQKQALIRLPLFDFPGMEVKVDERKVPHWHDDCRGEEFCLGLITFQVPEGEHTIDVHLGRTWDRWLGDSLSLISLLVLGYLIYKVKK